MKYNNVRKIASHRYQVHVSKIFLSTICLILKLKYRRAQCVYYTTKCLVEGLGLGDSLMYFHNEKSGADLR